MPLQLVVDTLDGLDAAVAALYTKGADGKFALGVEGLPDVAGLQNALKAERKLHQDAVKALKAFEGLDAEEVRTMLAKLEGDGESALIKAGKIDELVAKRTEKLRQQHAKELEAAQAATAKALAKAKTMEVAVLDNHTREAAGKVGMHSFGAGDALLNARQLFVLDDDGNVVQRDSDGNVVMGKDGKTPFSLVEWMEGQREVKPHWWPATASGSGAPRPNGAGGRGQDLSKLSPTQRMEAGRAANAAAKR